MRERISMVASSCTGSASSRSSIVTRAAEAPSSAASTFVTFPTSTPAIRTGARGPRFWASRTTAFSSKGFANGFVLVNPK
jgi:hypothetical protein